MELSEELWLDSQRNELWFWETQLEKVNIDQQERNRYYLSYMEGQCGLIKNYLRSNPINNKVVMDLGSGPQGFLHVLQAKKKVAIDPLMDKFREIGYTVDMNDVESINMKAEDIGGVYKEQFDVVFCLNSIDHHQAPKKVIENIYEVLKEGGDAILLTDLRKEEECDSYHKLPIKEEFILESLQEVGFNLKEKQIFGHGLGNPIKQLIVWVRK